MTDPFKHADRPPGDMIQKIHYAPLRSPFPHTKLPAGRPTKREVLVVYLEDGEATLQAEDGYSVTLDANTTRLLFRYIDQLAENA